MSLSCDCGYDDDGCDWYYYPQRFAPLKTKYRRHCKSCSGMIELGADCLEFERYREPQYDIEEAIYGEGLTVPLASWYFCEHCGELYHMLTDLGFCFEVGDDMRALLKEYQRDYAHPAWRAKHFK